MKHRISKMEIFEELSKYKDKINAMVEVSLEGDVHSLFKLLLLRKTVEQCINKYLELDIMSSRQLKKIEDEVDEYLNNFTEMRFEIKEKD